MGSTAVHVDHRCNQYVSRHATSTSYPSRCLRSAAFLLGTLITDTSGASSLASAWVPSSSGASQTAVAGPSNAYTGLHPWLNTGERLKARLIGDDKDIVEVDYAAAFEGMRREPAAKFAVPIGLRRLRLLGTSTTADGKDHSFDVTWNVVDIAKHTQPLYERQLPFVQRIEAFLRRLPPALSPQIRRRADDTPARQSQTEQTASLDALEKRLNLRLPAALRVLIGEEITFGDAYFVKPTKLTTVTQALLSDEWSYTDAASGDLSLRALLSPATRARYDRSILVFVDAGDGLGALAWDPAGVAAGEPSHIWVDRHSKGAKRGDVGKGVWFWLHQERLDEPQLLLDNQLRPSSDEDALLNPFQRFAVPRVIEEITDGKEATLVIDSAHPHGFLQLHFLDGKPVLMFRSYGFDDEAML